MATLKFNAKKVEKLVQHALAAVQHTRSYGQNNDPAPALHLVMDGMYLISNGEPYLPGSACGQSALNAVVYAEGYEPPNRLPPVGNELLTAARLVRVRLNPMIPIFSGSAILRIPLPCSVSYENARTVGQRGAGIE
jgi:hypothetical protein